MKVGRRPIEALALHLAQSLIQLENQLVYSEARCYDNDWIVRMEGRKEVEALMPRIERMKKRIAKITAERAKSI